MPFIRRSLWVVLVPLLGYVGQAPAQPVKPEGLTLEQFERMVERIVPAEMRKPLEPVKPEDNAWAAWEPVLESLSDWDQAAREYFLQTARQEQPLTDEQWDWMAAALSGFEPYFKQLETGLARPGFRRSRREVWHENVTSIGQLRLLIDALIIRSRLSQRTGELDDAVADAVLAFRVSNRFGQMPTTMTDAVVASMWQSMTCERLRNLVAYCDQPNQLATMLAALRQAGVTSAVFAVRGDFHNYALPTYRRQVVAFQPNGSREERRKAAFEAASGGFWMTELTEGQQASASDWLLEHITLLDAEHALEQHRRAWLALVNGNLPTGEIGPGHSDRLFGNDLKEVFKPLVAAAAQGKTLGREESKALADSAERVLRKRGEDLWWYGRVVALARMADADAKATQLFVACRLHESVFGELPEQLDALVNEKLIDSVPTDPFDGEPMRYDAERGLIWSVGVNGTDENAATAPVDGAALLSVDAADLVWSIRGAGETDE